MALRTFLKSSSVVLSECGALAKLSGTSCSVLSPKNWSCTSALTRLGGPSGVLSSPVQVPVRQYRVAKKKKVPESQMSDLPPSMLKMDYAAVPAVQTTSDLVKRILSLELASQSDKLKLKTEQLVKKVQRDEHDQSSVEVKVAILTAKIRNYKDHMYLHHKDMANKRHMLLATDRRKKYLKNLRLVNYEAFEKVCTQLDISYSFPPDYYRPITRRWLAKKDLCNRVFQEVQKQKAAERLKQRRAAEAAATISSPSATTTSSSSSVSQ